METTDGFDSIPETGDLSLYVAGEKIIMKRRDAARERMFKHQSPIKSIVALIEAGASEFELSSDWGSSKPVTEELKRNFKKASNLNPEQIEALNIAIKHTRYCAYSRPSRNWKDHSYQSYLRTF